ncbi:hypothetical protein GJ496_002978 [Pomphorhynchus laevis]|nr:hypothetical protein GJ496_002978 [Pomphorhynchus laevis]
MAKRGPTNKTVANTASSQATKSLPVIKTKKFKRTHKDDKENVTKMQSSSTISIDKPNAAEKMNTKCDTTSLPDSLLHPSLIENAKEAFQLEDFTTIQAQAIPIVVSGKDIIIKSRTGTGKTFAYCLPLIHLMQDMQPPITRSDGPIAVILLPTRELSMQTFEIIQKLVKPFIRIVPTCFIGGTNRKHEKDRIRKGVNILIGTPGRIEDHIENTASLDLSTVKYVVLDEADRMLDMGFQKSMEVILNKINEMAPRPAQKILLSATIGAKMHWLSTVHMNEPEFVDADHCNSNVVQTSSNTELDLTTCLPFHLKHFYLSVPFKQRLCALVAFILRKCLRTGRVKLIIFFSTNDSVLFHYEILDYIINSNEDVSRQTINFTKLHGSMPLMDRRKNLASFAVQSTGVLLCTDVAARGLDFNRVNWIIQYNGPQTLVDYIHRSGRTARHKQTGKVLIFLDPAENQYLTRLSELGLSIKPLSLSILLKSLSDEKRQNRKPLPNSLAAIDRICQNRVQNLQFLMEQAVINSEELKKLARDAYASFVRGYSSYGRDYKGIFHTRNLHLGHVAKSFALRETPSEIIRACSDPAQTQDRVQNSDINERLRPANVDTLSEFASGF